jgi:hypothetical protein
LRLDQTLVQVRERTFLDVMDLALIVVRERFWPIVATAALGIGPWAVLNAWLTSDSDPIDAATFRLILMAWEAPIATAPITILLGGMMFGKRPRTAQLIRSYLGSIIPLIMYQVILRALMLWTFVLSWLIPLRLPFVTEVIVLERGPWRRVIRRASELTGDRTGDLFAQWIAIIFFGAGFALSFWFAIGKSVAIFNREPVWEEPDWSGVFGGWGILGLWIAIAFFAVVRFLTYIDQRIRLEGWEVELKLKAAGLAMIEELEA